MLKTAHLLSSVLFRDLFKLSLHIFTIGIFYQFTKQTCFYSVPKKFPKFDWI